MKNKIRKLMALLLIVTLTFGTMPCINISAAGIFNYVIVKVNVKDEHGYPVKNASFTAYTGSREVDGTAASSSAGSYTVQFSVSSIESITVSYGSASSTIAYDSSITEYDAVLKDGFDFSAYEKYHTTDEQSKDYVTLTISKKDSDNKCSIPLIFKSGSIKYEIDYADKESSASSPLKSEAEISQDGIVSFAKAGKYRVKATVTESDGKEAEYFYYLNILACISFDAGVEGKTDSEGRVTVTRNYKSGDRLNLSVDVKGSDEKIKYTLKEDGSVNFSSFSLCSDGKGGSYITYTSDGRVTVQASAGFNSAELILEVKETVIDIKLKESSITGDYADLLKKGSWYIEPSASVDTVYSYTTDDEGVVRVDESGKVTVCGAGEAVIKVSGQKKEGYVYKDAKYNVHIDPTMLTPVLFDPDGIRTDDKRVVLNENSITVIDGKELLPNPYKVRLCLPDGEDSALTPLYTADKGILMDSEGNITNPDDIVRLTDITVMAGLSEDDRSNYTIKEPISYTLYVEGDSSLYEREGRYTADTLYEALDGRYSWSRKKDTIFTMIPGGRLVGLSEIKTPYFGESIAYTDQPEHPVSETLFYCWIVDEVTGDVKNIPYREYYGVDTGMPVIGKTTLKNLDTGKELTIKNVNGFASNSGVRLELNVSDTNLYRVALYNGDPRLNREMEPLYAKIISSGQYDNIKYDISESDLQSIGKLDVYIAVYDKAGNETVKSLAQAVYGDNTTESNYIIYDKEPPVVENMYASAYQEEGSQTQIRQYEFGGNIYFSGPAQIAIDIADRISGLDSAVITVDGENRTYADLKESAVFSEKYLFATEGKHTVKVLRGNICDYAGNTNLLEYSKDIYIDKTAPSVRDFVIMESQKGYADENGNYCKSDVVITFKPEDSLSGVANVKFWLDDGTVNEYECARDESGKYSVSLGADSEAIGEMYIWVEDNVGNSRTYTAVETVNNSLKSNFFIMDSTEPVAALWDEMITKPQYGEWYNDEFTYAIKVEDRNNSSGLKYVKVYVNGKILEEKSYGSGQNQTRCEISHTFTENELDTFAGKEKDGRYVITVEYEDYATNTGQKEVAVINADLKAPKMSEVLLSVEDKKTLYADETGIYANGEVMVVLKATDAGGSGLAYATARVGKKSYTEPITDNGGRYCAIFTLPVGSEGIVDFAVTDKAGLKSDTKTLTQLSESDSNKRYPDSFIIIEDVNIHSVISVDRFPDANGKWYNRPVVFTIETTDEPKNIVSVGKAETDTQNILSSGIKEVTLKINGKKYRTYDNYKGQEIKSQSYMVVVDEEWINDVINDDGSYTVTIEATDFAGNHSTDERKVYIDNVAPVIADIKGVENNSSNRGVVSLIFEVAEKHYNEQGVTAGIHIFRELDKEEENIYLNDFVLKKQADSTVRSITQDGHYKVSISCTDAAGNMSVQKEISFELDNTAPKINLSGIAEGSFIQDSAVLYIAVEESNYDRNTVNVSVTRELNGITENVDTQPYISTQKNSVKEYGFDVEGTYTVTVTSTDAAGNEADAQTLTFTIDTNDPEVSITGIENGAAYNGEVVPVISINDNYYAKHNVSLVKTSVKFDEYGKKVSYKRNENVTDKFIVPLSETKTGAGSTSDTFEKKQDNDGIYELTVTAEDLSGRETKKVITFSVNRYGSVYTYDDALSSVIDGYLTEITEDFTIYEYNADKIDLSMVRLQITLDGSPVEEVKYEVSPAVNAQAAGESGWYEYRYTVSKENFEKDGVYVINLTTRDMAGNISDTDNYDNMTMSFRVDSTKPEITMVNGLGKKIYNAKEIEVYYSVFDAIGLGSINIYVDDSNVQSITEFDDVVNYSGNFIITDGRRHHIRIVVEDLAGNITDTDDHEDKNSGKVAEFNNDITISTNFFVRFIANKKAVYGTAGSASGIAVIVICAAVVGKIRRRKEQD